MTNKPTIDGVSRELILKAANRLSDLGQTHISEPLFGLTLNSPAVERQEPVTMKRQYLTVPGLWIECADDDPQAITFYKQTPEVAALQSTIARLEARVAELESGRGEPVAYLRNEGEPNNLVVCGFDHPDAFKVFRVPPAPVAVVLPERKTENPFTPNSMEWHCCNDENAEWNACLDATAALNKSP